MNSIVLIGRLTRDPESRFFESGTNVTKFALAVDKGYGKDKEADFFDCEAWGKTAEVVANYCQKGKQVCIQGRVEFEHWNDKATGQKRSKPIVKIDKVQLLGGGNGDNNGNSNGNGGHQRQESQPVEVEAIPF